MTTNPKPMTGVKESNLDCTGRAPDLKSANRRKSAADHAKVDRLPPYSPEAEQGILGCILLLPNECMGECVSKFPRGEEAFYDLRNQTIYAELAEMYDRREAIDVITLQQRLKDRQLLEAVGGLPYLATLPDTVPSAANFTYYLDILRDKLLLRKMLRVCTQGARQVYEHQGGVSDLLNDFEREALAVRYHCATNNEADKRTILLELQGDYDQAILEGKPIGLRTGFIDLDKLLGGLKPQQLMVIAARPSVGKTALSLDIAGCVAVDDQLPVGFFSLEMSSKELLHRLGCSRTGVDSTLLNEGRATEADLKALAVAHAKLEKAPLHICDRGNLTLAQLTAEARRMVQRHGIKLLVVDYLGLLRSGEKFRSRYEETTLVSNGLKGLAKELSVSLIALCQLNRDTEREGRPPRMSDLRDSGAIEQDADIISLLHRGEDQTTDAQQVSLIVAKHRNGRTGKVDLVFRRRFTRFESNVFSQDAKQTGGKIKCKIDSSL